MLWNKLTKSVLPSRFLWRLTLINVIVVGTFIVLSSWAIYNTACFLADGLGTWNDQKQNLFNSTLFQYLWIFSIAAIFIGSFIHYYLVKKTIRPLKELIESTKRMKEGQYPVPIQVDTKDEMGQLIGHFNDLVKQLKDTQRHRKELISDLSHEFRTPLTNLKGYLGALKDGVVEGDQKMYESLHSESERLIHMVEQLEQLKEWDYFKEQSYSEKEPMNMQLLVEQSVEMFRWSLKNAGIKVKTEVDTGIVKVYNEGILQVINNLLDNAIKYYEGTGPITIKGEIVKGRYTLSIIGPGQAIPLEAKEKIFERLYRVDPSRERNDSGGTGLGLAISKEIIEHHDGKIRVKSEGNCHTFTFSLPVCT
ncbi:sensor histidine kinase [Pseudalkalibacillus hwajinpoensis]|uniref:histidine kinase n=1 Tax=Guptibacillus hwajinpoensis TaxID=208199 RepID=A0A4U1MMS7_9BACL|nr:HAMP domain-containing sensor histidine kinase [Pseudalkalibacillus hwajinpoensis]TKD72277.1 HAMP domain-containing histidine kinase [Pseudalkalibacillus hwajinpoensis]